MAEEKKKKEQYDGLFRIAVIGMSIISGYTTAMGAIPLFGVPLSIALAIVLSILLVALALRLPSAYETGQHRSLIIGYICVAMVSIIFNFNFLYGKFAAEDLLYSELNEKKENLSALKIKAKRAMDEELGVIELGRKIEELDEKIEYEKNHPVAGEEGCGPRCKAAIKEREPLFLQYQAKIKTSQSFYDKIKGSEQAIDQINKALGTQDLDIYRSAIESATDSYNEIAAYAMENSSSFTASPEQVKFVHKDIGKLDHSIWTLFNFFKFTGRQIASIFVALIISMLIDLVVLFVIVLVSQPEKAKAHRGRRRPQKVFEPSNNSVSPPKRESIFVERKRNS